MAVDFFIQVIFMLTLISNRRETKNGFMPEFNSLHISTVVVQNSFFMW